MSDPHRCEAKVIAVGKEARCANPAIPLGRFCLGHTVEEIAAAGMSLVSGVGRPPQ